MITQAWRLLRIAGHDMILCLLCDKFSFNPHDIGEVYCGYCDTYLRDVARDFVRQHDDAIHNHDPLAVKPEVDEAWEQFRAFMGNALRRNPDPQP